MTEIKVADISHIEEITGLAKNMVLEGTYSDVPFNEEMFRLFMETMMKCDDFSCFIAVYKDEIIGFLLGDIVPHIFSSQKKAVDLGYYVAPDWRGTRCAMKLLEEYEEWALSKGVQEKRIYLGSSNGYEKSHDFFEKMGYTQIGGVYQKEG